MLLRGSGVKGGGGSRNSERGVRGYHIMPQRCFCLFYCYCCCCCSLSTSVLVSLVCSRKKMASRSRFPRETGIYTNFIIVYWVIKEHERRMCSHWMDSRTPFPFNCVCPFSVCCSIAGEYTAALAAFVCATAFVPFDWCVAVPFVAGSSLDGLSQSCRLPEPKRL